MSAHTDIDPRTPLLPFDAKDLDRAGLRLLPAEFARLMDVSKQSVSKWISGGKILLGVDGRLDPRVAVRQLLRNSDPARLRSRILAPLMNDLATLRVRVRDLETALAVARSDAAFHAESNAELIAEWDALFHRLRDEWPCLRELPTLAALEALDAWRAAAEEGGGDPGLGIRDAAFLAIAPPTPPGDGGSTPVTLQGADR